MHLVVVDKSNFHYWITNVPALLAIDIAAKPQW